MIKKKIIKSFTYKIKVQFTKDDITEIFNIFKSIDKNATISINNYELEDITEINKFTKSINDIEISMGLYGEPHYGSTYLHFEENQIFLQLTDVDDIILLGLKSKIEIIINNRQNPVKKESIIDNVEPKQHSAIPQQDTTNKSLEEHVETKEIGFYEKHKGIIDAIIAGIVLIVIGLALHFFFRIG